VTTEVSESHNLTHETVWWISGCPTKHWCDGEKRESIFCAYRNTAYRKDLQLIITDD
jgi:hypothetical protein